MIKSNNIYQISNNSSNEQMLANITNQACDRFIPNRNHFKLNHPQNAHPEYLGHPSTNYSYLISQRLFDNKENCKAFNLPQQLEECKSQLSTQSNHSSKLKPNVSSPVKILDIPHFKDDFYLNNIDWSQAGPLGIALNKEIFLYTPENITQMGRNTFKQEVSGIKINQKLMAVGCTDGSIEIYDLERCSVVRTLVKHQNRVAALMFMDDFLVSGSKDKTIVVHDLRQRYHCIKEYANHKGQICTLKAKNKNQKIFASGSVDGSAIIWDLNYGFIDHLKGHKGAVKALDWCPWKSGILATGGGNQKDKSIKLWNTNNSKLILQQPIQSQISGIVWNQQLKMMITSHGFSNNQLNFWNLNTNDNNSRWRLQKKKSFQAHSRRVLNMLQSADGSYLCTVGGDQTLKLWSLKDSQTNPFFPQSQRQRNKNDFRI